MRWIGSIGAVVAAGLSACATVQDMRSEASGVSTYSLCMRLAAPGLLTNRAQLEVWRDTVAARGDSCNSYQADMDRASRQQAATMQSLTTRLNQQNQPTTRAVTPVGTGFYKRSFRQGNSLICVYDRLGNPVYITMHATEICPLVLN